MHAASLFEAFASGASRFGDRPFLRAPAESTRAYASGAIEWTYGSARGEVARLQALYAARGLRPGARVAVAFDSRLDVYLHLLALNGLGGSLVPLNTAGTDRE
ncbi:MAG TPA: hypothetical protein VE175_06920, partial [Woeseiaceae bacterium]|nr:hypothetical protein [Woeseiaceae bacterium]